MNSALRVVNSASLIALICLLSFYIGGSSSFVEDGVNPIVAMILLFFLLLSAANLISTYTENIYFFKLMAALNILISVFVFISLLLVYQGGIYSIVSILTVAISPIGSVLVFLYFKNFGDYGDKLR